MEHSTTQIRILRVIALLLLASVFMGCFATAFAEDDVLVSSEPTKAPATSEMPKSPTDTPLAETEPVEPDEAVTDESATESAAPSEDSNDALTELQPDGDADDKGAEIESDEIIDTEPVSQVINGETEGLAVSAVVSEAAGFPAGTTLSVSKITNSGAYESAMQAVADGYRLAENNVLYFIPYDVGFYCEDSRVEPASGSVAVTMTFSEPLFADELAAESDGGPKTTELSVAHILADGTVEKIVPQAISDTEISFETKSFSVIGPALVVSDDIGRESSDIYVPVAPGDIENAKFAATIEDAVALAADNAVIWLTDNVSMDMAFVDGKNLTVRSYNGNYVVSKNGTSPNMFVLDNGASLTLESIIVDSTANTAGRTITASGGSTLILGEGAVLENNRSFGAISLDSSMLSVNGGTIRNNTTTNMASTKTWDPAPPNWTNRTERYAYDVSLGEKQGLGGAVLMVNGSVFTISSGEVSGNSALCGGAIYAWGGSNIALSGGLVSDNTATGVDYTAAGGAIAVDNGTCVFTINGAEITGNSAKHGGAFWFGIDTGKLDFSMTSGSIRENTATDGSVAYFLGYDSQIDISGNESIIENNTASGNGAFYVGMYPGNTLSEQAFLTVRNGATFSKNHAAKGSCMYLTRDKGINGLLFDGAVFTNNATTSDGGVLRYGVPNSTFTVRNSTFTENKTDTNGGCFYVATDAEYSTFVFDGSTFNNNYAQKQGGVWRGFPPYVNITYKNCEFDGNTAETGDGGCFYCPGDGPDSNITIDGGTFTGNKSGGSGGAFRANLNGGTVAVTGGAVFSGNSADVNAGAFSVRRKGAGYYGTVQLLSCTVDGNWCNADFSRYTDASDYLPTVHYNTGGIYIGENIVCHMYDALVTGNYVESGYTGNMVGSGIGLCPNAEAYLLPSHGSMVYGNGDGNTMDILAVPYDPVIDHETPAKLYISDVAPDGRDYNWTDLDNDEARTGMYDWTNIRNGISMAAALDSGYHGETTLDPVGFKANIDDAGIMTMAASGDDGYEVRIIGNYTKGATYAAGGIMVNGTIFSGEFDISVEKKVEYPKNIPAATLNEILNTPFSFRLTITDNQSEYSWGYQSSLRTVDVYNVADDGTTKPFDAQIVLGANNCASLVCEFTLKADEKINLRFVQRGGSYNTGENSYTIELQETDPGGADNTVIEYSAFDKYGADITDSLNCSGSVLGHMDFVCTNTFIPLILPHTGSIEPASLIVFSLLTCISGAAVVTVAGRHIMRGHAHPVSSSNKQNGKV